MKVSHLLAVLALAASVGGESLAQQPGPLATPTAADIVAKNAEARGGADAWHKIETMAWTGHVESSNAPGRTLSFLLEQQRPNNVRFEMVAEGQKSIRVYDGRSGWKLRATPNGKPEIQPYSEFELKYARGAQAIDGPLMDYATNRGVIELAGVDAIADRKAYVLNIRLPSGGTHRVWVDAETFLELRHDREYRSTSGQPAVATVFYRDYRQFQGLQMPVTIETGVVDGQAANKLIIERVALNPPLDSAIFTRPAVPMSRRVGAALVDTRSAVQTNPSAPSGVR